MLAGAVGVLGATTYGAVQGLREDTPATTTTVELPSSTTSTITVELPPSSTSTNESNHDPITQPDGESGGVIVTPDAPRVTVPASESQP